jgi:hypothetical protein
VSDLLRIAWRLSRTCNESARNAGRLDSQAKRLRSLAAEVGSVAGREPSAYRLARGMMAALEEAATACTACAAHLRELDQRGREYVAQLVGGLQESGSVGADRATWYSADPMSRLAAQSDWWPPNGDLAEAHDHVFFGHITFRKGARPTLSGKHANTPGDRGAVADPPRRASRDAPAIAHPVVPGGELQDELGYGPIVKKKISTLFPTSWSRSRIEAAIREAWFSPDGTREFNDNTGDTRVGGFWTGVGDGLRIEGFFDLDSGRCTSAWPVVR